MGSGSFTESSFRAYADRKGFKMKNDGSLDLDSHDTQEVFSTRRLVDEMNIHGKVRECCDTQEHPNTVPVIIGIDVTGSMGPAAKEVASQIGNIMTGLFKQVKDVEFLIMGIGDLTYDDYPLQVSQFESDNRISEHLDRICFEGGGGGNDFESYTEAWFVGAYCTALDCWKRGKKGLIITIGDEKLNPYLPARRIETITGIKQTKDHIETKELLNVVKEKYELAHIHLSHSLRADMRGRAVETSCSDLGVKCITISEVKELAKVIVDLVVQHAENGSEVTSFFVSDNPVSTTVEAKPGEIAW